MSRKLCLLTVLTLLYVQSAVSAQNQPVFSGDASVFSEAENFWTPEEAERLFQADKTAVGRTPASALVTLVFDRTGYLVTPETYNAAIAAGEVPVWDEYVTDLQTFRAVMKKLVANGSQNVTRLETATVDYVKGIGYDEASAVFLYDPYQSKYETEEEMREYMEEKAKQHVPPKERQ